MKYKNIMTTKTFLISFAFFCLCWMVIAKGDLDSLWIGIPTVFISALLMVHLQDKKESNISIVSLFTFILYFSRASIISGVDIARRSFMINPTLAPAFIYYETSLQSDNARVFFANAASLIPGTVSAGYRKSILKVHLIDENENNRASLKELEIHVAKIFNQSKEVN